ncbi:MAG: MerR family transcriptional regulator [Thomasclavelia sp.]|nr:MerR family transcriptional regulator [Thomasclavelia sp.]
MYSVKEVSEILNISPHTIRYYTDQGLVPHLKRNQNNNRLFDDESIDWLKGCIYLRELGLSMKDVKSFVELCLQDSDEAIKQRYQILKDNELKAKDELEKAKVRYEYLKSKSKRQLDFIGHHDLDNKNPAQKYKK